MRAALQSDIELSSAHRQKQGELVSTREHALRTLSVENIQHLDSSSLLTLQRTLRHGDRFGIWVTPPEWEPPGSHPAMLSIDLRRRIEHHLSTLFRGGSLNFDSTTLTQWLDHGVLLLARYLVLLRMGPAGLNSKKTYQPLDPNTITDIAYGAGSALFACAIAKKAHAQHIEVAIATSEYSDQLLLRSMQLSDLEHLTKSTRRRVLLECNRMRMLAELDLWLDAPSLTAPSPAQAMLAAPQENEEPKERESHLPLPDDYLAEMARRSLWIMRDLAPNVLSIAEKMVRLWERTSMQHFAGSTTRDKRRDALGELLAIHRWIDHEGNAFDAPPFLLQLTKSTGFGPERSSQSDESDLRWPPENHRDVLGLLGTVQVAHYFIVALSTGARASEIVSLERDCVFYAVDGRAYANGKTYKLVQRHDGESRDWLLPDIAVDAIEQQVRLVSLAERLAYIDPDSAGPMDEREIDESPNHLWGQLSGGVSSDARLPLRYVNLHLRRYALTLRMETSPGGQNLRSHRFRKTLARLVALALTQAPKLLMDVFGHKSIEMTLYYILTNKELRAEIETVSRELRVMRAKEVIERMVDAELASQQRPDVDLHGYGGLATISIQSAITTHRQRIHRRGSDWNANSAIELAELLTLQGKAWEQVRKGILCTKLPGESGPCNRRKGRPEPSKCQSSCVHRLEEAFLREDIDAAIQSAVDAYEHARSNDEPLIAAHWAGQIRTNIPRFSDLQSKWVRNATVRALMVASTAS